jgi:antitoxin component YwqK of YwqJK toxin-antitoxin module
MKKNFILCLISIVTVSLNGQSVFTTYHDYLESKKHEVYEVKPNTKFKIGSYKRYDEAGTLIEECRYKENKIEGVRKLYYDNSFANYFSRPTNYYGRLFSTENYSNGILEGKSLTYQYPDGKQIIYRTQLYKNGELIEETENFTESNIINFHTNINGQCYENYKSGKKLRTYTLLNSLMDGEYLAYHENGIVKEKGNYLKNSKIGVWQYFDENNIPLKNENYMKEGDCSIVEIEEYSNSKLLSKKSISNGVIIEESYFENGNLKSISNFVLNEFCELIPYGTTKEYFESGILQKEYSFVNGKKDGISTAYFESGAILNRIPFEKDVRVGQGLVYYETGEVQIKMDFLSPTTGYFTVFYKNGNIKGEGKVDLSDFKEFGEWKYYNEDGSLDYLIDERGEKITAGDLKKQAMGSELGHFEKEMFNKMEELKKICNADCIGSQVLSVGKGRDIFMSCFEIYNSDSKMVNSYSVPFEVRYTTASDLVAILSNGIALINSGDKEVSRELKNSIDLQTKKQILLNAK